MYFINAETYLEKALQPFFWYPENSLQVALKKRSKSSELGKIPFTSNLKGNQIDGDGLEPFLSVSFEGPLKVEKKLKNSI